MIKRQYFSDVVLEDRPWPRGSSRTKNHVLGLGLEGRGLGLGLGLEGSGLDYKHVNFICGMFRVNAFRRFFQNLVLFCWLFLAAFLLIHSVCELKCVCLHSMFKPH